MKNGVNRFESAEGPVGYAEILTGSPSETETLGMRLGMIVPRGATVSLEGGLGAGKTVLVKGLARGLGIEAEVLSPTFILAEEYLGGEIPLLHYDLYRLEDLGEVEGIGMFDAIDGTNIVVVEWGDRLPEGTMRFDLRVTIRITGRGKRSVVVMATDQLLAALAGWKEGV